MGLLFLKTSPVKKCHMKTILAAYLMLCINVFLYVLTLFALVARVYIFAYDYYIHSVLVHFYTSSTSVFSSAFLFQYTTLHRILHKALI